MEDCGNASLKICELPAKTQSFDKISGQITNDESIKGDLTSLSLGLFSLSSDSFGESPKIEKTSESLIKQNDFNANYKYDEYSFDNKKQILERTGSSQYTLCTECKFSNCFESLLDSANNTQRQTQLTGPETIKNAGYSSQSCFSQSMVNQINGISEQNILSRSFSTSPTEMRKSENEMESIFPLQIGLKRFKSADSVSNKYNSTEIINSKTMKLVIPGFSGNFERTKKFADRTKTLIAEVKSNNDALMPIADLKIQNSIKPSDHAEDCTENLGQKISRTEVAVQEIEKISLNETDHHMEEIDTNIDHSTFSSQSTIKEIHDMDSTDEIYSSRDVESIKELQETHSLKYNTSTISGSTIEKVYYIDANNEINCSTSVTISDEKPQCEREGENSVKSIINDQETTGDDKMLSTVMIASNPKALISSQPNDPGSENSQSNTKQDDAENLNRIKELDNNSTAINCSQAENKKMREILGDPKTQCLTEPEYKKPKKEDKRMEQNTNTVEVIDDSITLNNLVIDQEFTNERESKEDESFLDISIESELEQNVRLKLIEKRNTKSVHIVNDPKTNSIDIKTINDDNKETRNEPVDLTIVESNIGVENLGTSNPPDAFNTQLPIDTEKLDNIGREDKTMMRNFDSKDTKISNEHMQNSKDDNSWDSLPESELQRIEKEACEKDEKRSTLDFEKTNANQGDVFYKPERLNTTIEKIADDLVLPNWVTNPVPEPNYEKMRHAIQMKTLCIRKMLQEILRLSAIVSKVQNVYRARNEVRDLAEAEQEMNSRIEGSDAVRHLENNLDTYSAGFPLSSKAGIETSRYSGVEIADSDIFYVPQSSKSANNVSNKFPTHFSNSPLKSEASVSTEIINPNNLRKDLKKSDEFYVPQSKKPKYDTSPVFNHHNNTTLSKADFSSSYIESHASNMFSFLKPDFNDDKSSGVDVSSNFYRGRERQVVNENNKSNGNGIILKNNQKLDKYMKTEDQFYQKSSNAELFGKINKTVLNLNNVKPINDDSIFYSPDKLSSASSNYTGLSSIKNNQISSSNKFTKELSNYIKPDEPKPHTYSNNDSIFYNGNRGNGINFDRL